MDTTNTILVGIAVLTVLVVLVFAFSGPDPERALKRRMKLIVERFTPSNEAALAAQMRRTIAARLPSQEFGLAKMLPNPEKMSLRLRRTGRKWTLANFMIINVSIALVISAALLLAGAPFLITVFASIIVGFGIPHMVISKMISKRVGEFTSKFPDAIELLVRGLRSGLPIAETLHAVSTEVPGPVGVEFRQVIERVRIGKTLEAALQESADMLDTPEFQFFCITLAIQRETGGNLAETLGNLAEVLRKRAQMKLKIAAMSSEAKASAWIVGALPFLVFGMIYMLNPGYLEGFFPWADGYDKRVMLTGLGGLVWMSVGVFIMSRMVAFEI